MIVKLVSAPHLERVVVPEEMGTPRSDQMQGNKLEQLAELTGRICYDSLGKGRDSASYHQHIIESGHHGVYRGSQILVNYPDSCDDEMHFFYLKNIINRPGFHMLWPKMSFNPSCILGWHKHRSQLNLIERELRHLVSQAMPLAFSYLAFDGYDPAHDFELAPQLSHVPEFRWYSFYLSGSRYFSHEQVRHSWHSGLGQRSTRYCNETDAKPIRHPYMNNSIWTEHQVEFKKACEHYAVISHYAKNDLGMDKKQVAGAARFELLGSCETEMIFSASLDQWFEMIRQRMSRFAEVEIRLIYNEIYNELSNYENFPDDLLNTEKASDGHGFVLVGG